MWSTIKYNLRNKTYHFNRYFGWLMAKKAEDSTEFGIPEFEHLPISLSDNLKAVLNPYLSKETPKRRSVAVTGRMRRYAYLLHWMHKYFYPGLYLCSFLKLNMFNSGVEACDAFCSIFPDHQDILCLPRSIFIASTSQRFNSEGTLFIGVLLPTRSMHAWVFESGANVWRNDHYWINYTPLAVMYHG